MPKRKRRGFAYAAMVAWVVFNVSLATWWMIFGLRQAREISRTSDAAVARLNHVQRMFLWEGVVLITSLLGSGMALTGYMWRERQRHEALEDFFAALTHDLKTSLTSLRLQVESLESDFIGSRNPALSRLFKDAVRLQLQLENALFLGSRGRGALLNERISLERVISTIRHDFPDLAIVLDKDCTIAADSRAFEIIVRNLFHNAVLHGGAHSVAIHVNGGVSERCRMRFTDDGHGAVDADQLGQLFSRPAPTSKTGVGLYISRQLVRRMGGEMTFRSAPPLGLEATVELPKAR
jgi:signal transduction histidine kinase